MIAGSLESWEYLASYQDLIAAFGTNVAAAANHYDQYGVKEGRSISFDAAAYLSKYPDLQAAFGSDTILATQHYITFGREEGRTATADTAGKMIAGSLESWEYLASYPDLITAFGTDSAKAAAHYNAFGINEHRTIKFNSVAYLTDNPDLQLAFGTNTLLAAQHYVQFGYAEGRTTAIAPGPANTITIHFDTSFSQAEQDFVTSFHNKIVPVLGELLGFVPTCEFNMSLNPANHRTWGGSLQNLLADTAPSTDPWFKSWYTVELAHLYFQQQEGQRKAYPDANGSSLRDLEYFSQTITSVIAKLYGTPLGMTETEKTFYAADLDSTFSKALDQYLKDANTFSVFQTDTNYAMNSTTITTVTHELLKLYNLDNDFFKNIVAKSWNTYQEYKAAITASVTTMPANEVKAIVDNMMYFKQIDLASARPSMNLEIALFSNVDLPGLSTNKQFYYDTPTGFVVYGQSNNSAVNPPETDLWAITPDPALFNSVATVTLRDAQGNTVQVYQNVDIQTDFANQRSGYLPGNLIEGGHYTITAEAAITGVKLTDSLEFTYHA